MPPPTTREAWWPIVLLSILLVGIGFIALAIRAWLIVLGLLIAWLLLCLAVANDLRSR